MRLSNSLIMRTLNTPKAHLVRFGCARYDARQERREANMAEKVRLNLQVSSELNKMLEDIAESAGTNRADVIRQALALMNAAYSAKKKGKHVGFTSDPNKLDTEIVGLL